MTLVNEPPHIPGAEQEMLMPVTGQKRRFFGNKLGDIILPLYSLDPTRQPEKS
jgi:hypothetical protein